MQKSNQRGFGALGLLIVIAVLALIGAGGWYVHGHQKSAVPSTSVTSTTKPVTANTNTDPAPSTNPTLNWVEVASVGDGYSIKVPDGWKLTSYPGDTLNGDNITYLKGTPAVITTADGAYAGEQKKFNVNLTDKQYAAPQWQSPNQFGTEATTDFSIGNITGKKYSIEYTQTVTGVTKGDKIYQYVFNLASGKQLSVVYMQSSGDADNLAIVEQAIKSIVMK